MALALTSPPPLEPVMLAEAKAHLRVDASNEDILISSLIVTSRLHIEAALDLALIDQSWVLQLDKWPRGCEVEIPISPLKAVVSVRVKDSAGVLQTVPATAYLVDLVSRPARIVFNGAPRPDPGVRAGGIEIAFTAGFGATGAQTPAPLRHAILQLVAHWYEHRSAVEIGAPELRIPDQISDLIAPFRKIRL